MAPGHQEEGGSVESNPVQDGRGGATSCNETPRDSRGAATACDEQRERSQACDVCEIRLSPSVSRPRFVTLNCI